MFNFIIIDDEKAILENFSNAFDWNDMGFNLSATFYSVSSALDYIKDNAVNVILSDVVMPDMNGLDLAKIIQEQYPNILLVFISGYKDFEYAKDAIKYGVFDYLLKPVQYDEIIELFKRLKVSVQEQPTISQESIQFPTANNALLQCITGGLLTNEPDNNKYKKLRELLAKEKINIDTSPCTTVSLYIDDFENYIENTWEYGLERMYSAINTLTYSDKFYMIPTKYTFNKIEYFIFSINLHIENFLHYFDEFTKSLIANCFEMLNMSIIIKPEQISIGLENAILQQKNMYDAKISAKYLYSAIKSGNVKNAVNKYNELTNDHENSNEFINFIAYYLYNILSDEIIIENLRMYNIYPAELTLPLAMDIYNSPCQIELLVKALPNTIKAATLYYSKNIVEKNNLNAVAKAKKFIEEHYGENISLSIISNHVFLSEAYFSRLFKDETKVSYIDYLNNIRIEKAKELLVSTNYKINKICSMVGYMSNHYFTKRFKLITGFTPNEYRVIFTEKH